MKIKKEADIKRECIDIKVDLLVQQGIDYGRLISISGPEIVGPFPLYF